MRNRIKRTLTVVVVTAILIAATLAVVGGRYGWWRSAPSESGNATASTCEHTLARHECPFCSPNLIDDLGLCGAHGVPEALCTRCNGTLIAAFKVEHDWCAEHNLPESQCVLCNPGLATGGSGAIKGAHAGSGIELVRQTRPLPRAQRAPSASCTKQDSIVRFASPEIARAAGLQTMALERRPVAHAIECNAQLTFNAEKVSHIAPRVPGVVHHVYKAIGDRVEAGAVMAVIDSTELGSAKADHLQAAATLELWKKNYQRQLDLSESGLSMQRALLEAQSGLTEAQISYSQTAQRLRNLGLSDPQIEAVLTSNDTSSLLEVAAPFAGTIVDRHLAKGEIVDQEHVMFTIADTSTMWAMLDIREEDVRVVKPGQGVVIAVSGLPGETLGGVIGWVASSVDARTRTLQARADIDNSEGLLRANMFGRATITVAQQQDAIVVPKSAVQWEGCCNVVFVKHTDTVFQPYKVRLGFDAGEHYVVEAGLEPGEEIVTQGAFLLKTEILKGSIGAGCCETHTGEG